MILLDVFIFSNVFWLVIIGNVAHLLIKWSLAIRRKDYRFRLFWQKNIVGWLAGVLLSEGYAYAVVMSGNLPALTHFIGYGLAGSSLGKNILKHTNNAV